MIQHFRSSLFLTACALALISPLAAQDLSLEMDPAQSKVEFTLGDVLHTVRGSFQFKRGAIRFDLGSGKASGELLVDARSGASGNDTRDRKMHKEILESQRFPDIVFRPRPCGRQTGAAGRQPDAGAWGIRHPRRRT
jgi:polyisoprenoid-binding protein YceI